MSTPEYIRFGPKRYRYLDLLTFLFFNAMSDEEQDRFIREFEVDASGQYVCPSQQQFQDSGLSLRWE